MNPPYLQHGDGIAFAAPARKVTAKELNIAINLIEKKGYSVRVPAHLLGENSQFSGTDKERTADFQQLLDDPNIKAIFCVRGGYGSVRVIDKLDFTSFCKHPKWICGYSDITVFHAHIHQHYQMPTLHCAMPTEFKELHSLSVTTLFEALVGKKSLYTTSPHPQNRLGTAEGVVIGGNLSVLYSLLGSSSEPDCTHKILFLEDVDEYLYHIDRMMIALKRAGKLQDIAGLIVGGLSKMHDNEIPFGKNATEIIYEHCAYYSFPMLFNFPAGHIVDHCALKLGVKSAINVTVDGGSFVEL
ncbi:MAG: LD-carboxypeptidase [Bacteroidales bacterium]|jgi:muramoyltetrapeptide carboxypeptidase|nr:LD-carboxypeptidase [Bacteroidales bacterium]